MEMRETKHESALSIIDNIDAGAVSKVLKKIADFQAVVQMSLREGHDFGVIPGTTKPSLLKAGAEKINMMMGVASEFEILAKIEDYEKGFFAYNIRCRLSKNGNSICEGVGSCNSKESKYVKQDAFSIANTILKMAKKRAYIDATLSLASLSEIFTQDIEELDIDTMRSHQKDSFHKQSNYNISDHGKKSSNDNIAEIKAQVLPFGRHKGKTMAEVLKKDREYIVWLAEKSDNANWKPLAQKLLADERQSQLKDNQKNDASLVSTVSKEAEIIDAELVQEEKYFDLSEVEITDEALNDISLA